jgi:hypothetical protein
MSEFGGLKQQQHRLRNKQPELFSLSPYQNVEGSSPPSLSLFPA